MSYAVALPMGGIGGWAFLKRTQAAQLQTFSNSSTIQRDTSYFRENIAGVETAEQLVNDRRLLSVALGAFGLKEDLGNRFFIRKVLESNPADRESLAFRLSDKRYLELSRAFGFGAPGPANTIRPGFADEIVARYETRQFQIAVGEQDENMRLALAAEEELSALSKRGLSETGKWYLVMGAPPLRKVFETALGLPASMASLELDQQLNVFREAAQKRLGTDSVTEISSPERREKLIRQFLVRAEAGGFSPFTPGAAALTLLQAVSSGGGQIGSL